MDKIVEAVFDVYTESNPVHTVETLDIPIPGYCETDEQIEQFLKVHATNNQKHLLRWKLGDE